MIREFITLLGDAAAWRIAARAQQGDRVRRIGVLMGQNEAGTKTYVSVLTQALSDLGWADGRNVRRTFEGSAITRIGYEPSRRSWLARNPTSS
jgi:putative ABC transport system substrate-binding protein